MNIDHLSPFIRTRKGNTYLLVITDAFTVLKEIFGDFGLVEKIISDRGTAFTSKLFEIFCITNHIQPVKTAVRMPRANGQVERSNTTVLYALRTSTEHPKHWNENLKQLQWAINSQFNVTTHFTPNELVFNYDLKEVVHNHLVAAIASASEKKSSLRTSEKRIIALENVAAERQKWKLRFDKKHSKPTEFEVGNLVVIRVEPAATGESKKLKSKY